MVASPNPDATSITIFGATGIQGGSVLRHLLQSDKPYRIRAVTRDPTKDSAKKLSELGVEVVKAELGDESEVVKAVEGQDLVFAVTNFWEHGRSKELADGKRLMDAVKSAGTKTVYWSGLMPVHKLSGGKYTKVEHFDTKAEILAYAKDRNVPIVDVQPACYMENFTGMMLPRKQEDGSFVFALPVDPASKMSLIDCGSDYGAYVRGAIESGLEDGSEVLACRQEITMPEFAEVWGQVNGVKATYYPMPSDQFKAVAGEEITEMMGWFSDFGYYGGKEIESSQKLLPEGVKVNTWKTFVEAQDWSKVLA
ncbi:hypothetical protein FFLO_05343 [Filobasidium floriforme]|uniref:NmrA-like domain-containing protein n=1 Tax=Filobasidium floriforme TaxID=5210 RepID=A0A8K0JHI4_9TREE|nr:hypothetical protein FFLO_05343 [Filobasidium floriforme]